MKKLFHFASVRSRFSKILLGLAIVISCLTLTSCYVDTSWSPQPPGGWNSTFYDQNLTGYWQLVEINGYSVTGYDTNYLYFNGNGRGIYYYYYNGRRMWENTAYWCQDAVNSASYYQINIQYESSGSPSTMNYWFADRGRTLYMQWRSTTGVQTYIYVAIPGSPW